ncbi:RagB/SusD family nutrient uptake outer membrane protein [Breznakibacter xylanolyticus]|nr:RagB/SusD family nutrient uptake outer membrane protein [Breznakibacter xylanolyticus]
MKYRNILNAIAVAAVSFSLTACDDFLDRPNEDSYNVDNFYQNDEQLYQTANQLYSSPWYDFQRGFIKVGEVMSGNYYMGSSPYLTLTVNSSDADLATMSASLWSVNAYCNTLIKNVNEKAGSATTETVRNAVKGEALTWKAMTYFFLVRSFGAVPIIHENSEMMASNTYNDVYKAKVEDVYAYIVQTLEQAIAWLPESAAAGRIDKYCAEGLLAKVYLAKSGLGMSGTRNEADLKKAAEYAKDVIDNSGRELMPNYADIFRLANNTCPESLIAWRWTAEGGIWTAQNSFQSDLAMTGFDEYISWGGYGGPSVDLIEAFDEDPTSPTRQNIDSRRKATLMMAGDVYEYFWTDLGGFDVLDFCFSKETKGGKIGPQTYQSPTGANCVKHLVGDNADHVAGIGHSMARMATSLATHILRLSDVYLIYVEAMIGNNGSTTNQSAIDAFYAVRHRARSGYTKPTSVTWEDVWKERRLELACEGDRWYDFVRLSYYDQATAISELTSQKRNAFFGLNDAYKVYWESGNLDASNASYDTGIAAPNVTSSSFTLPFPDTDLALNKHLLEDPIDVDVTQYKY